MRRHISNLHRGSNDGGLINHCAIEDTVASSTTCPTPIETLDSASPRSTPCAPQKPVPLRREKQRPRIHRPDRGSLYDILHEHAGTSLFVPPNKWTDSHMKLLDVRWQELSPCDTPRPIYSSSTASSSGHVNRPPAATSIMDKLMHIQEAPPDLERASVTGAIRSVFETLWPNTFSLPSCSVGLSLHVGTSTFLDVVTAELMWNLTSDAISSQSSPISSRTRPRMICYIDMVQPASSRSHCFHLRSGPPGTLNKPVARLQQIKARKLVPASSKRDPYLAGVFLAMAQSHFYPHLSSRDMQKRRPDQRGRLPSSSLKDVNLQILTHDTATSAFIVYTAHMTKEFLRKFHDPFKALPDDSGATMSGFKIGHTSVPLWPFLGLRERLGKAFGQDVVGVFNTDEMETWGRAPEESRNVTGKRKVAKSSLGEEPADEPAHVAKRQR
ncbi:hypothetical protein CEP54_014763 [Fusarium duplospermum]|uniref:Uncharacterized protein n=1 Tax=Fusarium duplospermum TaxID=1325734 RepID=A0A428NTW5_9HYPO|nr:hypothetical protein CEP54_014763 [Fusarium duplospermum]